VSGSATCPSASARTASSLLHDEDAGAGAAGHLDEAEAALSNTIRELETYGERYAEPLVLEAEAVVGHARGDDAERLAALLGRRVSLATEQGARGVTPRVAATADRLGLAVGTGTDLGT
jgi:hypothetical protein